MNDRADTTGGPSPIGYRIARGTAIIVFMWGFWKLGGFVMLQVVNAFYGKGPILDAYTAVYRRVIYLLFYSSLLKVVQPAFMPLFAELRHRRGDRAAWEFASTVLNLLMALALGLCVAGFVFAREIVATLLPEFSAAQLDASAALLRWMAPGLLVASFSIVALAILTSYKNFTYPAAADAIQKLTWAAALVLMLGLFGSISAPRSAPTLVGGAFLVGCGAQSAVLLLGLRGHLKMYRPGFPAAAGTRLTVEVMWLAGALAFCFCSAQFLDLLASLPASHALHIGDRSRQFLLLTVVVVAASGYAGSLWLRARGRASAMARFAAMTAPLIVGVVFARYRNLSEGFFQSYLEPGRFGLAELARSVADLPTVLFGYALSVAMIPFLCDLAAQQRREELGALVGRMLRFMALFFVPLTLVALVLSEPVMRLLWDHRGTWSASDLAFGGMALGILVLQIPWLAFENVLMQSFFSLQDTVLPTAMGIIFSLLQALGLYVLIEVLDLGGWTAVVLFASVPIRVALKNACLLLFLRRRLRLQRRGEVVPFAWRLAVLCAVTATAAWLSWVVTARVVPISCALPVVGGRAIVLFALVRCVHVFLPAAVAGVAFVALAHGLGFEEFRLAAGWLSARLGRSRTASAGDGPARG